MPNVKERIAGEGIRFTHSYTPCALCAPARASFFSGLYPTGHGMYNNYHSAPVLHSGLFAGVRLFSEQLREAGYDLSYIGKWHVSGDKLPTDYGWTSPEDLLGPASSAAPDRAERRRRYQMIKEGRGWQARGEVKAFVHRPGWGDYPVYGTLPGTVEGMRDWERGQLAAQEIRRLSQKEEPWVLYVGLTEIHDPFFVVEPYASMYDPDQVPLPENYADTLEDKPAIYRRMYQQLWSQLSERQVREAIAHYWGLCTMNDDVVGTLLDTLEEGGVAEDTFVLYCSDHGEQVGSHRLFLKGVLPYEESYHVPIVVRGPGVIDPGRTCDAFVTLCDLAPTFCEMAGAAPLEGTHGRSIVPLLRGATPSDWPQTFYGQFTGTEYYYTQRIVRDARYKYVFNGFDFDELYDLEEDPHEITNLAQDPSYEDVKRRLVDALWEWVGKTEDVIFNPYPTVALVPYGPTESK